MNALAPRDRPRQGDDEAVAVSKSLARLKLAIIDMKAGKAVEGLLPDLEERFRKILSRYGEGFEEFSLLNDIKELISIMEKHSVSKIETNGGGWEIYTDKPVPKHDKEELLDIVHDVAWDIDCILTNEFVSDVNVIPAFYEIMYDRRSRTLKICHNTVWDNA